MGYVSATGDYLPFPIYPVPNGYRIRRASTNLVREFAEIESWIEASPSGVRTTSEWHHNILTLEVGWAMVASYDLGTDGFAISERWLEYIWDDVSGMLTKHGAYVSVNMFAGIGTTLCMRDFALPGVYVI